MRAMVRMREPMSMLPPVSFQLSSERIKTPPFERIEEMTIKRIVHVVARNGRAYDVPMTAEQAAFYLRLAEFKAVNDPAITFNELVAEKSEQELQRASSQYN
jgi:HJR/Mrr/RecB family endonuclease